jgi:hypothetical protein
MDNSGPSHERMSDPALYIVPWPSNLQQGGAFGVAEQGYVDRNTQNDTYHEHNQSDLVSITVPYAFVAFTNPKDIVRFQYLQHLGLSIFYWRPCTIQFLSISAPADNGRGDASTCMGAVRRWSNERSPERFRSAKHCCPLLRHSWRCRSVYARGSAFCICIPGRRDAVTLVYRDGSSGARRYGKSRPSSCLWA